MKEIQNNVSLIARCGLYCGACGKYLNGKCPGCIENEKATWCQIRSCTTEHGWATCAQCTEFANPKDCKKYNNFISKMVSFVLRSDRSKCIAMIKEKGPEGYASFMTENKRQTLPPS